MRLSSIAATATLALLPAAFGATVLSENFDELTAQTGVTSVGAFSTINGTNVDIVGPGNGFGALCVNPPESGNCVDMDGSGGNPIGQLQSNMAFANGNYLLSFDLIGNQRTDSPVDSSVTVTFGNYTQTFNLSEFDDTDGIVINQAVTVSGGLHANLLFVSNDPAGDVQGELLDNVLITTPAAGVPEPSSMLLLGSGLLFGAIALARRRRA